MSLLHIGTAGWNIPPQHKDSFPTAGSHLERYAACLTAVEINSSFYRPHRASTYARWRATVPDDFRFAVKLPRTVTHECRLEQTERLIAAFADQVAALGEKMGPLLVQLPPSLAFVTPVAERFFQSLRRHFAAGIACEPRHASWFGQDALAVLNAHGVARVAADPAVVTAAAEPAGNAALVYYRWHGSPVIYHSSYPADALDRLNAAATAFAAAGREVWCIFDNTARGAAAQDALLIEKRVERPAASLAGLRPAGTDIAESGG